MRIIKATASFTRPNNTTAYAANQLVANSTTAGSVTPLQFNIPYGGMRIFRASVTANSATSTNAKFRIHLYSSSPTVTNGDGGAWLSTESGYQGFIDTDATSTTFSDNLTGFGIFTSNSLSTPMYVAAAPSQPIYGLLMANAAYTPTANEVFTVSLLGDTFV